MPLLRRRLLVLFTAATVGLLGACGSSDDDDSSSRPATVVALAQSDARFSTLVEALQAAGLVSALQAEGPVTVFAPTNAAFAAALTELGLTKEALFANQALLTQVLKYHVVSARVMAADVPLGKAITPLDGGIFKVDSIDGKLLVTDASNRIGEITQTDLEADNGVVHVVDKVLLPTQDTIVNVALAKPDFSILVEAVQAAGLAETLSGTGPFTVFAPTNAAFAALLTELGLTKEALLANKALLSAVLTYHVVPSRVLKAEVPLDTPITTAQGASFTVDETLSITDARGRSAGITATDILSSNGVIHVIDKVLLPPAS